MAVKYACTALIGTNKTGKLTPDTNGYYRLCVGALNFTNSAGIYYDYDSSRHVFESSASFMRRINDGCLYGEEDHPQWTGDMSLDDYVARIKRLDPEKLCCHFRDIEVIPEGRGPKGEQIYMIYASVKPDRGRGALLKAALENPDQNVCFSLRALVDDKIIGGRRVRTITDLITFDWVVEPGLSVAKKWNAPGLEAFVDGIASLDRGETNIPLAALERVVQRSRTAGIGLGMESAAIDDLEHVIARERANLKRQASVVSKPLFCK